MGGKEVGECVEEEEGGDEGQEDEEDSDEGVERGEEHEGY